MKKNNFKMHINELAKDALAHRPVNENLLNLISTAQKQIQNMDIVEAMNQLKENMVPEMPVIDQTQVSQDFTFNEFGEIIRENNDNKGKLR